MQRILKYVYSILLILCVLQTKSQKINQQNKYKQQNHIPKREVFVRIGTDLSRFLMPYIGKVPVSGFEVFADYELKYKYFPTVELGMNSINFSKHEYNYNLKGYYFRLGANYNMVKYQHHTDQNIFYVGLRYAFSNCYQKAENIILENEWGKKTFSLDENKINTHWVEGNIGVRGEIFKNIFIGLAIRIKMRFLKSYDKSVIPYFVPGFGNGANRINTGISYTVSYAIPIVRVKSKK